MQTPVSHALHLQVDGGTDGGTAEMPDVSTRLDVPVPDGAGRLVHVGGGRGGAAGAGAGAGREEVVTRTVFLPKRYEKYWKQRYRLFSKFDQGIRLDAQGWYSVTPEAIAKTIAQRFRGLSVVADLFSGAGGNCIQFALHGAMVLGVEHSLAQIEMARHNARVYEVEQYMDFIHGDVYSLFPGLQRRANAIDAVFMSPPWGGPDYRLESAYDVSRFRDAVEGAKKISPNVAILVPRNVALQDIAETFGVCEVQANVVRGKVKTYTIYFGGLMRR